MRKSLILILTIALCLSVSGFVLAGRIYYGGEFRSVIDASLPDFGDLEAGELVPGEYRLNLQGGRFGFDYEYLGGESSNNEGINGNNFFIGLDVALREDLYLSVGYDTLPEYTTYESEYYKDTNSSNVLSLKLNYFLNDDTSIYGGYSRQKNEFNEYYNDVLDDSETYTTDYFYLGTQIYGSFLK